MPIFTKWQLGDINWLVRLPQPYKLRRLMAKAVRTLSMLLLVVAGCCEPPPSKVTFESRNGIEIAGQSIMVKSQQFNQRPTIEQLRAVLGEESRTSYLGDLTQPGNTIWVWDELGIQALSPRPAIVTDPPPAADPKAEAIELAVRYGPPEFTFDAKVANAHALRIDGVVIGKATTMSTLQGKGYADDTTATNANGQAVKAVVKSIPPFTVSIRHTDDGKAVNEVAIGMESWKPAAAAPAGTTPN